MITYSEFQDLTLVVLNTYKVAHLAHSQIPTAEIDAKWHVFADVCEERDFVDLALDLREHLAIKPKFFAWGACYDLVAHLGLVIGLVYDEVEAKWFRNRSNKVPT